MFACVCVCQCICMLVSKCERSVGWSEGCGRVGRYDVVVALSALNRIYRVNNKNQCTSRTLAKVVMMMHVQCICVHVNISSSEYFNTLTIDHKHRKRFPRVIFLLCVLFYKRMKPYNQ